MNGAEPPRELKLVIDPCSEPISGSLGRAGGAQQAFAGWLDLVAAIDALSRSTIRGDADGRESP